MKRDVSYLSASSTRALISTNQTCFIFFHDLFNSFQLRNLSTTANLEGFLVLVSRDPNSNSIVTGGSLLGEQFIDMMSKKQPNPWRSFFSYVSGHAALADITGTTPSALLTRKKRDRVFKDPLERAYDKGEVLVVGLNLSLFAD
jgi:hypothetical protein